MRKCLLLCILIICLVCNVSASERYEYDVATERLHQSLPSSAERILRNYSLDSPKDRNTAIRDIILSAIDENFQTIRNVMEMMFRILVVVILCNLGSFGSDTNVQRAALMSGSICLMLLCSDDVKGMISVGKNTMDELSIFSSSLLPIMAAAAASSGSANGATALYAVTVFFSGLLIKLCNKWIVPMVYCFLALAVSGTVLETDRLRKLREFLDWIIKKSLKWMMYLFTGFLSVSGVLAGSADAAALKAVKMTISGMVPVVGGIVSDAADTVLAGAALLKASAGTLGMIGILAIFLIPFLKIGIWFLGFRFTAAISTVIESKLSGCIDAISQTMGYVLAMVGSCSLMNLLACFSLMKTVV